MHTIAPYAFCGLVQFNFTYIPHVQEGGERGEPYTINPMRATKC